MSVAFQRAVKAKVQSRGQGKAKTGTSKRRRSGKVTASKRASKSGRGIAFRIFKWASLGVLGAFVGSILLVLLFRFVNPPTSAIQIQRHIEARLNGKPFESRRAWADLEHMAPCVGLAVIAAEDQNFTEHSGFDWDAIQKALIHNDKSKKKRGASTVSQQVAKNVFLWSDRSWIRKGFEVYFTFLLESFWPKRRILEIYLNTVEFGQGTFGVESASRFYFQKPSKQLRSSEAALLAAVLPNPHRYQVDRPSSYVLKRQSWILRQMRQLGGEKVVKELAEKS